MEENLEIVPPGQQYVKAKNVDIDINLNLENSENLLRIGDRDIILDIDKLYDNERNQSNNYKIYGKIKMIFRNLYTGTTEYNYLKSNLFLNSDGSDFQYSGSLPYDEFAFLRKDVYREYTVVPSGTTLGTYQPQYVATSGYTGHTTVTPIQAPYHNWNLYLSYVYDKDVNFPMGYNLSGLTITPWSNLLNFVSGDGIPFRLTNTSGSEYELTSPVQHGMKQGEYIILTGSTNSGLIGIPENRIFYISSIGNAVYDSEKYVVNIKKSSVPSNITFDNLMLGKRCIDINNISGSTCQYYVHKHKTLTNVLDYIMDDCGFELPIFEEEKKLLFQNSNGIIDYLVTKNRMESVLFDFKEAFVLTGITNNLEYTPTEVYLNIIFRNGNGYFDYPPKLGYSFNFHNDWNDVYFSGSTSIDKNLTGFTQTFSPNNSQAGYTSFTGGTEISKGSTLTGAFIEYNPLELKERTISECFHKLTMRETIFNYKQYDLLTYHNSSEDNPFGLYYQPQYKIKLRELSPYIETANTQDVFNLPENAQYDGVTNTWRWRDLYDHGYIDTDGNGTNFPFVNGNHYVISNINFYFRNELYYNNKTNGIADFNSKSKQNPPIC